LDKFCQRLTANIEEPVSSQSNPAAADFAKYASKLREQEIHNLESSNASCSPSPTATSKDK
jgi:hypothetical protein